MLAPFLRACYLLSLFSLTPSLGQMQSDQDTRAESLLLYSGTLRHVVSADAILNVSICSALTTFSYVNGHDLD